MHDYGLILTLAGGLTAAAILGYFTHRLRLSPIVGYLIAGVLVGPYTPGFIADASLAEQLAEIGVILLMFGVGLTFHLDELIAVRGVAIPGAIAQSAIATALGAFVAHGMGWSWPAGIVFGLALSVASTVVLVRVLDDNNDLQTTPGRIAVGWLVVEDLFTVIALVLIPVLLGPRDEDTSPWAAMGVMVLKVAGLVAATVFIGARAIPAVLEHMARTRSRELFTLAVLAIALGIAVTASVVFSVSMALGAFLAGMIVGRSDFSLRAASDALPMRDAFAVLFFVSVGMLLDPASLLDSPALLAGALAIVLVAKPLVAFVLILLLKYPLRAALTVAIALAQIGEFSFILASLGRELGLLTPAATNALVAASIVSIVLNPLWYRAIPAIESWWRARSPANLPESVDAEPPDGAEARRRAIVVGYGPTGRTAVRLLVENGIIPSVIDLNLETVRTLRAQNVASVFGDALRPETLVEAGVRHSATLILSATSLHQSAEIIRSARALNPDLRVLARAEYLRDLPALRKAGADRVYAGEGEVALAFVDDLLHELGATADQIERERSRAHDDLFGDGASYRS
jgi:CPA2 family monovalent cation:H+ antiporter-2